MSWPLLLSGHPLPILQDENALLLLSMIERAGLVAEVDLEMMSGVEHSLLQRHLYRLQMGRFIEHGASFMRLTEAGRDCIDRLSLYEEILEDILDSLDVHGRERHARGQDLRAYRKSCLRLYQNSLCTVSQWQRMASLLLPDVESRRRFSTIVVKSLLARDLRNWRMHLHPEQSEPSIKKYSNASEDVVHRIIWQILLDKPEHEQVFIRTLAANRSGARGDIDVVVEGVRGFHEFQAKCGPDVWFNIWSDKSSQLLDHLQRLPRSEDPSVFESVYSGDLCEGASGERHHFNHFNETWKPAAGQLSDHFITHLTAAKDILDLSGRLGVSQPALLPVLQALRHSCARLLPGGRGTGVAMPGVPAKPFVPAASEREKISSQAALWYLQLKGQRSVAQCWRFMRWLMHSPRHLCEFILICRQDQRLARVIQAARNQSNVTHVNWWQGSSLKPAATQGSRRIVGWRLAAAMVATLPVIFFFSMNVEVPDNTITTAVHEPATRRLDDGSQVSLDGASTLRVEFTDKRRHVHLLEGKAVFEVANDATRPFVVNTLIADITAAVAKFAVKIDTSVEVEVFEGRVEILPRGTTAGAQVITLRKGESYRVPMAGLRAVVAGMPLIAAPGDGSDPGAERNDGRPYP